MKQFIFIIFFIFYNFSFLNAQNSEIFEITGRVISEKNEKPVSYATILNLKKNKVTACDSLGYFYVTVLSDDILVIKALGYERVTVTFKDKKINPKEIFIIKLKEKTYKIDNVNIFDERWEDFVFEFSHSDIQKDPAQERINKWFYTLVDPKELAQLTASAAIGIPINFKSKADRQKIKVAKLKQIEKENKIIESKYNPDLVSELTGLNKTETVKFMRFCNFDRDYLLSATDYDIITSINKKFKAYIKSIIR
ncbi:MAG: carboxypeptidase-like regulatory domain-containing protein [Chlorobi bacterium]|nr:carboxypeptidase-like regulatory domain-containing protein [Chlorobiota bacterium]